MVAVSTTTKACLDCAAVLSVKVSARKMNLNRQLYYVVDQYWAAATRKSPPKPRSWLTARLMMHETKQDIEESMEELDGLIIRLCLSLLE